MLKIGLSLLTSALILVGCSQPSANQTPPSTARAPTPIYGRSAGEVSTPIRVLLILAQAPRLDQAVDVTLVVSSTVDAPSTTAEIVLPPGALATAGALTWKGDLHAQQPQALQATIKFVQEGNWTLAGKALAAAGGRDVWGDMAVIYLHVTRAAGQVGFPPEPNAPHDAGQPAPPAGTSITP